ncbi:MAG: hypothetical protein ACXVI9_09370 [Mucilaginibacter sp.]
MDAIETQVLFFNHIKSKLSAHLSFVDEVAELLNISNDSAYRRIRGEKPIGLDEIQVLCFKYKVSLDQLLQIQNNTVIFTDDRVDHFSQGFNKWLQFVADTLAVFNGLQNPKMYWFSKDLPVYAFIPFPELTAFKFFFWKRTLLGYPDLARQKFNGVEDDLEAIELAKKIDELYTKIPTIDIWNRDSINATISQIEFYRQANIFTDNNVLFKVYSQLEDLVNHLELQAETGKKLMYSRLDLQTTISYDAYINETLIGDNTVFVESDNKQITFINHSGLNFMSTQDADFCEFTRRHFQNMIRKSTHISIVGEKERSIFFQKLKGEIHERIKTIS